jgi:signal transduction histidine kinase
LTLLAAFGLMLWLSAAAVRSVSEAYLLTRLEHDAEALVAAVWVSPAGQVRMREGRVTPIYQQPLSGHYFQLDLADGSRVRSRSLWDEGLEVPVVSVGAERVERLPGPAGQVLLVRAAGYASDGLVFSLAVAEDLAAMETQIRRFQQLALGVLAGALVLVLLIQRWVLRRGFRTVDRVRGELRAVSEGQRDHLDFMGPVEIRPLSAEINRLLDQVRQRLQRSRQALGNLAHGLKAPLTLVTSELERLPLAPGDRERITGQLERVGQLVERELKRARFAGEGAGQRFEPEQDLPDLVEAVGQLHRARGIRIETRRLDAGSLPFDREDMLELLGNLLDNACKWARQRVVVSIERGADLVLRVRDDGPGIAAGDRARLLRRGVRLDEQEAGHGLGLAIVRELVEGYGGSLVLDDAAELGGLEVRVVLPLAAAGDE